MKLICLRVGIRVVGTLVGLSGAFGLFLVFRLLLPHAFDAGMGGMVGVTLAVTALLISVYEVYVGYLVWFRWSPLAVRHVVAMLMLAVWTLVAKILFRQPTPTPGMEWTMMLPMVGLVGLYASYRWLSAYWSRLLFPTDIPSANPLPDHFEDRPL